MSQRFGLIGKSLSHSFSQSYFQAKFASLLLHDCSYSNFEIADIKDVVDLFQLENIKGLNVTIPYKESILPFLNEVDAEAQKVGAVNCIVLSQGKIKGYNTDVYGFSQSIKPFLDPNHERALLLGTGGASKAIAYALQKIGVEVCFVTTNPAKKNASTFLYSDINERMLQAFKLVVNCSPVGTYPAVNECPPLPYQYMSPKHLAYDLVYNPAETQFLKLAKEQGAITVNGLSMLQLQAEKSWELWQAAK